MTENCKSQQEDQFRIGIHLLPGTTLSRQNQPQVPPWIVKVKRDITPYFDFISQERHGNPKILSQKLKTRSDMHAPVFWLKTLWVKPNSSDFPFLSERGMLMNWQSLNYIGICQQVPNCLTDPLSKLAVSVNVSASSKPVLRTFRFSGIQLWGLAQSSTETSHVKNGVVFPADSAPVLSLLYLSFLTKNNKLPPLSLANKLFLGPVPDELKNLTIRIITI
ncbi:hypothetical protein B0H13DRAFT_1866288 [Mycena leptocephala]|nr:hypothetical protein B0H13DRAFT_1866288 [Mycena leptocephala]